MWQLWIDVIISKMISCNHEESFLSVFNICDSTSLIEIQLKIECEFLWILIIRDIHIGTDNVGLFLVSIDRRPIAFVTSSSFSCNLMSSFWTLRYSNSFHTHGEIKYYRTITMIESLYIIMIRLNDTSYQMKCIVLSISSTYMTIRCREYTRSRNE